MGYNLAAVRIVNARVAVKETKDYIDETWDDGEKVPRKRGYVQVA